MTETIYDRAIEMAEGYIKGIEIEMEKQENKSENEYIRWRVTHYKFLLNMIKRFVTLAEVEEKAKQKEGEMGNIKIYGSTEYIEPKDIKVGVLKLEVNNMWDFKIKPVCFKKLNNGHTIPYYLTKCTEIYSPTFARWEIIEPDEEIKNELKKLGYKTN